MALSDESNAELLELLELLREERATQEQVGRIEAIVLADAAAMHIYMRYMAMTASLRHRLQGLPGLVESAVGHRLDEGAAKGAAGVGAVQNRRPWRWVAGGLAMAAALGLVAVLWSNRSGPRPAAETTISLSQVTGDVRIITDDGVSQPAGPAATLRSGGTVKTIGAGSSVVLNYEDGTRLALVNDSSVTCVTNGRKSVVLHEGIISAQVAPQPAGKPLILTTPATKIEVLGTQFALAASMDRTELNVSQGRVRLTRVSDGQTVEVAQGQGVVTNGEATMTVHEAAGAGETWSQDFEAGLPKGWVGAFVTEGLAGGSKGAVQAVRETSGDHIIYITASRHHWVDGLFTIHDDSHLHITFKMQRPDWLNVFFSTRGADATNPTWALHIFNEVPYWPPKPGEWRTVTIPLSKFRRKRDGVFRNEPPVLGEAAYSVSVSAVEPDRGLVIDRIWVTRGGPGAVKAEVLP